MAERRRLEPGPQVLAVAGAALLLIGVIVLAPGPPFVGRGSLSAAAGAALLVLALRRVRR